MRIILDCIKKMENFNISQDEVQKLFNDPNKNKVFLVGYATRIMLIHLRNAEKVWHVDLDELIGDTCLYANELLEKYIDRKLYEHQPGENKRGYRPDLYVPFHQYMQVMRMRIGLIEKRYLDSNPCSPLNRERKEYYVSELTGDDTEKMANDILDLIEE